MHIRRAAVIGSGTMGGAIAAHLANVGIPVDLLDIAPSELTPEEQDKGLSLDHPAVRNRIVKKGWDAQLNARPAALYARANARLVRLGNLEDNFDWLGEVDYIIEAIVENLAIKQSLMERLEKVCQPHTIIATNTSGLPIKDIADGRSKDFQQRFIGMHFFNPPRYLKLLEIIPHSETKQDIIEAMVHFGEAVLGKGTVVCKDTPNFIGNRVFSAVGAYELGYALENGYSIEEVDNIMGPLIGRPKTATFRLLDLVGLDVMGHVNTNLYDAIPDDESRDLLVNPTVTKAIGGLVERGWFGNKSGQGFYKTTYVDGKREFWTLDLNTMEYTAPEKVRFDSVGANRKLEPVGARIKAMTEADDRAGVYIRKAVFNMLAYCANRVPEISDDIVSLDRAVKWGFAHEIGPFEIWDALGVSEAIARMEADGFTVADWVKDMVSTGHETFYQYENDAAVGHYLPGEGDYVALDRPAEKIKVSVLKATDKVIEDNGDAALIDMGDGIALFEFYTKANSITPGVIAMGFTALERLEADFDGLVIGHDGDYFSAGANLDMAGMQQRAAETGMSPAEIIEQSNRTGQDLYMGFRYASKPVVAAPFGITLAGGAELAMAADRIVAHSELYMGLVEVGLGLVPAWGGCKELLRRVINPVMAVKNADPLAPMAKIFETIGLAQVSTSAAEAREAGFLTATDRIVTSRDHLLYEAKREARYMADSGYRPPMPEKIYAAGRDVLAALQTQIYMLHDARYASEHDALVANKLAWVLTGGDLSGPEWVDEQYFLDLEREAFMELVQHPKSLERIMHMLSTGKPLRN